MDKLESFITHALRDEAEIHNLGISAICYDSGKGKIKLHKMYGINGNYYGVPESFIKLTTDILDMNNISITQITQWNKDDDRICPPTIYIEYNPESWK